MKSPLIISSLFHLSPYCLEVPFLWDRYNLDYFFSETLKQTAWEIPLGKLNNSGETEAPPTTNMWGVTMHLVTGGTKGSLRSDAFSSCNYLRAVWVARGATRLISAAEPVLSSLPLWMPADVWSSLLVWLYVVRCMKVRVSSLGVWKVEFFANPAVHSYTLPIWNEPL